MNIIVCIKQVPGTSKVEIDPETGVLKRDGVESKLNPYDLYALETGLRLREQLGGAVTVITMGPPQAEAVIKEAYAIGVDDGVLVSDRKFAGSDVLATSYTLSQAIRTVGPYDLIICGKQTTDGDTAQVGPALAEHLGIPHVTWVRSIAPAGPDRIVVEQDLAESFEAVELSFPCLITVEKGIYQPRLPSYKRKQATVDRPVRLIRLADLPDPGEANYGMNGSPTQVERIFPPEVNSEQVLWEGDPGLLSQKLFELLHEGKFIVKG